METTTNSIFNFSDLFRLIIKWKKILAIFFIFSIILAVIFSGPAFIKPKYKSFAVLYPSNIMPYSEESETEQLLQLLQAKAIRDSVIKKFELDKHYKIDPSYKYYQTALLDEYNENVTIKQNENEAVIVEVMDANPQMACDMVNAIIEYYNLTVRNLHKQKFSEVMINSEKVLSKKLFVIDSLTNLLQKLGRDYGVIDYEVQSEQLTRGILGTFDGTNKADRTQIQNMQKNLELKGNELKLLDGLLTSELNSYLSYKANIYDFAQLNFNREYTHCTVVSEPFPADKKSYPVRWIIVLSAALSTLFLSIIMVSILENFRKKK